MKRTRSTGSFHSSNDKVMDNKNRLFNSDREQASQDNTAEQVNNPFENNRSVEEDIEQSQEEVENEQAFKEASTERD